MLTRLRHDPILRQDDVLADIRHPKQFRREGEGEPDAAVRSRIARHDAGMKCGSRPGHPLHPWHRRATEEIGMMVARLLEDAEHAGSRVVAGLAARDLRARDELAAAIDFD